MPCINDYVNYKTQGVCKIEDLRPMKFGPDSREREYYILRPVHQESSQIFVPADNQTLREVVRLNQKSTPHHSLEHHPDDPVPSGRMRRAQAQAFCRGERGCTRPLAGFPRNPYG